MLDKSEVMDENLRNLKGVLSVNNILLKDGEKYGGQYVATKSFKNRKVVCSGSDPSTVFNEAKKKGVMAPVVFYVPKKGIVQIYC